MIQRSINHYQKSINQLQIKNFGYNWLQLTWLPISQTLYWQINEIPIGYLIVAMGKFKTIHCTDRIYSIQAPWEINVLSNLWPEWNSFIESQQQTNHDEWGSINEFNIELNQLTPLQEYDIIIEPIFHKYKGIAESITTDKCKIV
ncbi:unnamed protein product [Schistosoma curassoni]|uniref:DUF385 domain-containing protein n=1 Tax=Schistosoma curassoni TaxID=6186 RepID=A0A183JCG8_9TREM|nr:unnamed protein product [Schistosoma curassoni]